MADEHTSNDNVVAGLEKPVTFKIHKTVKIPITKDTARQETISQIYKYCEKKIKKAVRKGKFNVRIEHNAFRKNGIIGQEIFNMLKMRDFTVDSTSDDSGGVVIDVSWWKQKED
jgi:hypothetical protein